VDVTPDRDSRNFERLADALRDPGVRLRVASDEAVDFPVDAGFLGRRTSWTLETADGLAFDLVFEPAGTSGYPDLPQDARPWTSARPPCRARVASRSEASNFDGGVSRSPGELCGSRRRLDDVEGVVEHADVEAIVRRVRGCD
jgi:hypothetical protein